MRLKEQSRCCEGMYSAEETLKQFSSRANHACAQRTTLQGNAKARGGPIPFEKFGLKSFDPAPVLQRIYLAYQRSNPSYGLRFASASESSDLSTGQRVGISSTRFELRGCLSQVTSNQHSWRSCRDSSHSHLIRNRNECIRPCFKILPTASCIQIIMFSSLNPCP